MAAYRGGPKKVEGPQTPPDLQEQQALNEAVAALKALAPGLHQSERIASTIISTWIASRCRQAAESRLPESVACDHGDARMKGYALAALPNIGAALGDLPSDVPFFQLSKDQVVNVLVTGYRWIEAAAVGASEEPNVKFNWEKGDEVPF